MLVWQCWLDGTAVSLSDSLARLPRPVGRHLIRAMRYLSLMRALEWRLLEPWLPERQGLRVLDVGCGHGRYVLDLARRGAMPIGCDLDRVALSDAGRSASVLGLDGRACFLFADGTALPLAEGAFDLVVCNCVLEHVIDDGAALAAMVRSLRPGGLLYLTVDSAEHRMALGFLEGLPAAARGWLLRPEVSAAPTLLAGLEARLDDLYAVCRRYRRDELAARLESLCLTVLESRSYLTGIGAAHYEAFHALRGLDPARGAGRLLYMVSSLLLYPLAAWSDDRRSGQGHGITFVARKAGRTD